MNISGDDFYALINDVLQRRGADTLQRSLYRGLREAILNGRLLAESRLPGSRIIAEQAGISRNTVNAALEQLTLEGFYTVIGREHAWLRSGIAITYSPLRFWISRLRSA